MLVRVAYGVVVNPNWRTPGPIIERVRHVFGGTIDLDPASDAEAQKTVRATRWIGKDENGLEAPWTGFDTPVSVFLNYPGGKQNGLPLPNQFWASLVSHRRVGLIKQAIVVAFSLEQLRTTQVAYGEKMLHFPLCIPRKRIAFVDPAGGKKAAPRYANAIVYVPGTLDRRELFAETFGPLGAVRL